MKGKTQKKREYVERQRFDDETVADIGAFIKNYKPEKEKTGALPREVVARHIKLIAEHRAAGTPLRGVHAALGQQFGFKLRYTSFVSYCREEALRAGIPWPERPRRPKAAPTPEKTPEKYNCPECEQQATQKKLATGEPCWQCAACKAVYADVDGKLTAKRIHVASQAQAQKTA